VKSTPGTWSMRASSRGGSVSLMLTPLELIERVAALIPPPRRHRHRFYGVLAPNAPLRAAVTARARAVAPTPNAAIPAPAAASEVAEEPIYCRAARYAWARLLAPIYEAFPLICPQCGGGRARHPRASGQGDNSAASDARPGATTVRDAGCRAGRERPTGPNGTGLRIRSARRLVGARARRAAIARHGAARACVGETGTTRPVL